MKIIKVKIEELLPPPENPNVLSDKKFNDLVATMKEIGYDVPIKIWWNKDIKKYEIVKGSHRFWGLKTMGETEVECVLGEYETRDAMLSDMVRDNIIKGELDPIKFTNLYSKIGDKYGKEATRQMFAFLEDAELQRLVKEVKKQLPEELKERLEEAKDEIKTIDDLSIILNTLFQKYEGDLKYNFMIFKTGNMEEAMYIKCDKDVWLSARKIALECREDQKNINEKFREMFKEREERNEQKK